MHEKTNFLSYLNLTFVKKAKKCSKYFAVKQKLHCGFWEDRQSYYKDYFI